MNREEVEKHLEGKNHQERIGYLNKILRKKRILSEETRAEVCSALAASYSETFDFESAGDALEQAGKLEEAVNTYDNAASWVVTKVSPEHDAEAYAIRARIWRKSGKLYEALGERRKAVDRYLQEEESWLRAGEFFRSCQALKRAESLSKKIQENPEETEQK